jgi:hypothetical protein
MTLIGVPLAAPPLAAAVVVAPEDAAVVVAPPEEAAVVVAPPPPAAAAVVAGDELDELSLPHAVTTRTPANASATASRPGVTRRAVPVVDVNEPDI